MTTDALTSRKILVTGGSTGIGAEIARLCVREGALVACMARNAERLDVLAEEIGCLPVVADVSDESQVQSSVDEVAQEFGGIDTVVNNAGAYLLGDFQHGHFAEWERMFRVNVLGVLAVVRASLPYLQRAKSADIVNISSIGARRVSRASTAVYSATKYALHALSDGMRKEFSPAGIRVTVVSPGLVDTPIGHDTLDQGLLSALRDQQSDFGLDPSVVARQVVRALSEPPSVNLYEIVVLPTEQPE